MEITKENFCFFTRFFPTQNNSKLSCSKLLSQYAINPRKYLQSDDPIWRHITLLSSAAHNRNHWLV